MPELLHQAPAQSEKMNDHPCMEWRPGCYVNGAASEEAASTYPVDGKQAVAYFGGPMAELIA